MFYTFFKQLTYCARLGDGLKIICTFLSPPLCIGIMVAFLKILGKIPVQKLR